VLCVLQAENTLGRVLGRVAWSCLGRRIADTAVLTRIFVLDQLVVASNSLPQKCCFRLQWELVK
jgi:hypothetical protein